MHETGLKPALAGLAAVAVSVLPLFGYRWFEQRGVDVHLTDIYTLALPPVPLRFLSPSLAIDLKVRLFPDGLLFLLLLLVFAAGFHWARRRI
jgi:hypothetical protein